MPTPQFPAIEDFYASNAPLEQKVAALYDAYIGISRYLTYLLSALDTLNVSRLDAKVIKTGTLDANLVTIRSDLSGGAFIQLDTNGIVINNGMQDTFRADLSGNVTLRGTIFASAGLIGGWTILPDKLSGSGVIEGGVVRSGPTNTARLELSNGKLQGILGTGERTGLYFDIDAIAGTGLADIHLYHNNAQLLTFRDNISSYTIMPGSGSTSMTIGVTGKSTYARGAWNFSNADSVSGLYFSFSGVTGPGGADNHTHAFSVSGYVTRA